MVPILLSCVSLAAATLLAQDPAPAVPAPTPAVPAAKPAIAHSFFVAGPDFTGILDEEGKVTVDTHQPGARDGWVLPNGNLLIVWSKLLVESTREGKVVLQYALSADNQELGTVQRLPSGNTLVT